MSSAPAAPSVAWGPPPAPAREVAPGLRYADTPSRVVGYIIDAIIVGIVAGILGGMLGLVRTEEFGTTARFVGGFGYNVLVIVLSALYFIFSWSGGRRATLGQRALSIQIGNAADGQPLTTEQAAKRWLGYGMWLGLLSITPAMESLGGLVQFLWVLALFITTATSPTKQGFHDRFAGSAAVRPTHAGNGLAMACLVALVALFVIAVVGFIALIAMGGQISTILSQVGSSV